MRTLALVVALAAAIAPANATTLLQLSLADMTRQSSAICRVKVTGSRHMLHGSDVFTVYQFAALQTLKASAGRTITEVAVPGGTAGGIRQEVAGAPALQTGSEYVLFLWTGRSGITQIIGLSQGVFSVAGAMVNRAPANEQMLDASGVPVHPAAVAMSWTDLKTAVDRALRAPLAMQAAATGGR